MSRGLGDVYKRQGLLYINSTSDAAGQVSIRLTFDPDTNPDVAQMQVQNKLQLAITASEAKLVVELNEK